MSALPLQVRLVVAVLAGACACEAGPACVELTVLFEDGVPQARVDEINAGIGARIVRYPIGRSTLAYVVRLRPGQSAAEAIDYYESLPEVIAAGENVLFSPPLDGPDGARAVPGCLDASTP